MKFSLNEIDAHCKKAVRGAGFEHGYAEETGKTLRWLSMFDLPGAKALAAYLISRDLNTNLFQPPRLLNKNALTTDINAYCCPILTGAWMCDRSFNGLPLTIEIHCLAYPILLFPYLAFIARVQQKTVIFKFQNNCFTSADQQINVQIGSSILDGKRKTAHIIFNDQPVTENRTIDFDHHVDAEDWQILNQFACRTYVPASHISRQGAGSEKDRAR